MATQDTYGGLSYRTANSGANGIYATAKLLRDAKKRLMLMKWAVQEDLPKNAGLTMGFRRLHNVDTGLNPILGDQNPNASKLSWTDFTATLYRYGGIIDIPEHMLLTHEDGNRLVKEAVDLLSYDMFRKLETLTYNVVKAGTNVQYAEGVANRAAVVDVMNEDDLEAAIATLEGGDAEEITELVTSSPDYNTQSIQPAFPAYCHSHLAPVVRGMNSFVGVEKYAGNSKPMFGEIGTVANKIRVVTSNIALPTVAAGGNPATNGIRGQNGAAHVYPFIIFAKNSFAVSKLAGEKAAKVMVKMPSPEGDSYDKLGLQGHVGYKTWFSSVILNNDYLIRVESGAPAYSTSAQNSAGPAF